MIYLFEKENTFYFAHPPAFFYVFLKRFAFLFGSCAGCLATDRAVCSLACAVLCRVVHCAARVVSICYVVTLRINAYWLCDVDRVVSCRADLCCVRYVTCRAVWFGLVRFGSARLVLVRVDLCRVRTNRIGLGSGWVGLGSGWVGLGSGWIGSVHTRSV